MAEINLSISDYFEDNEEISAINYGNTNTNTNTKQLYYLDYNNNSIPWKISTTYIYHNPGDYSNNSLLNIENIETDASKNDLLIQSVSSNIYFITDPSNSVIFQGKVKINSDSIFTKALFNNIDVSNLIKVNDISLLNNIILNPDISYNVKNDIIIDGNAYVSKQQGSQLKFKLIDTSDLDISINDSKNEILNTISNEYYKNNVVYTKTEIDNSFVLSISFDELVTQFINFDFSYASTSDFMELSNNFYTLDNSFTAYVNKTDNSFNSLNNYIDSSFTTLTEFNSFKSNTDISFEEVYTKTEIDNSFVLSSSFEIIKQSILQDISDIEYQIGNISGDLVTQKIQELSGVLTDICNIRLKIYDISALALQIENNVKNLDVSYLTDLSFENFKEKEFANLQTQISNHKDYINDASQTFIDILTQQPNKFTNESDLSKNLQISTVNLSWNYNNIKSTISDPSDTGIIRMLSFFGPDEAKKRCIPFIDTIVIDISGTNNNNTSTGWITYQTINIANNQIYYTDISNINILRYPLDSSNNNASINSIRDGSNNKTIDVRIYGTNFAENYPSIDDRAIYFYDLSFGTATAPSKSDISLSIVSPGNIININGSLNEIVKDNENENNTSKLNKCSISYKINSSLRASIDSIDNSSYLQDVNLNLNNGVRNYQVNLNNLLYGITYDISCATSNTLVSEFSEFSNKESTTTNIPDSNGISTDVSFEINSSSKTNISNSLINNASKIYINPNIPTNINFNNTNIQSFEISNPNVSKTDNFGFGKFIENLNNLVTLNVSVNNISLQTINYDGSFSNLSATNILENSNSFNFISNNLKQDIYTDISKQGLRLKGNFKLNDISYNEILNTIGDASENAYTLKYSYTRSIDVSSIVQNKVFEVYVDDLSGDPVLTNDFIRCSSDNVVYNMGIPSIQTFTLDISQTYTNINSQYKYVKGNEIISDFNFTTNSNIGGTIDNFIISNNNINNTGKYLLNSSFNNLYYTSFKLGTSNTCDLQQNVHNLVTTKPYNNNIILNHYCDRNSFNTLNEKITTSNLDLSSLYIYELSSNTITNFSSNLTQVLCDRYTNHQQLVKEYTLLYIDGKFMNSSNNQQSSPDYPNVSDFSYTDPLIYQNNNYNHRDQGISGDLLTSSSGSTYKWIVFKIDKNSSYIKTDNQTSGDYEYLQMWTGTSASDFSTHHKIGSLLNEMKNANSTNVYGFIKQKYYVNNISYDRIGRLDLPKFDTNIWYQSSSNYSFNHIFNDTKFGSLHTTQNNSWGPIIDKSTGDNDIYIYIGVNNNANFSI